MTLRILGGKFGGRNIKTVRTEKTRPTTSLVRKAVFDILQSSICDATFLDLFAGSGAMGIEAMSRGAKSCTFIDSQKEAIRCIEANVKQLGMTGCTVVQADVIAALEKLRGSFDIIYADPPYHNRALYLQLIHKLDDGAVLK